MLDSYFLGIPGALKFGVLSGLGLTVVCSLVIWAGTFAIRFFKNI